MARIAAAMNEAGLPYMVIGGQAVIAHGRTRLTKDIDFTLAVSPFDHERVAPILKQCRLIPLIDDAEAFVKAAHLLPLRTEDVDLRVDLAFTDTEYVQQAIARGEDVVIEGVPVRFATAEDLVIHKLIAWRGVDQQDIQSVLLKNPDMDLEYVRRWALQFEEVLEDSIVGRLEQALREAQD